MGGASDAGRFTENAVRQSRRVARDLAFILNRTAAALDESATLAEEHAEGKASAGRTADAERERRAARRARTASERARAHAVRCAQIGDGPLS